MTNDSHKAWILQIILGLLYRNQYQWNNEMEDIRLECSVDGTEYKEYSVLINDQPLGVISWKGDRDPSEGCWYTTASDGNLRYFHTQEEVIEFLRDNPLKSATELSAKLKAEAKKLMVIAEEIEVQSTDVEAKDQ